MAKRCFKCGETKPRTEFYAHPMMSDGLLGKCKSCARLDVRANRAKRRDYYNAYDRARGKKRKKKRDRRKDKCRRATRYAIKQGTLTRPDRCQRCGCNEKLEIHHYDYDLPLWVLFVCHQCHCQIHAIDGPVD